jgi:hypothetical protein
MALVPSPGQRGWPKSFSLKMYYFMQQCKLTKAELTGLSRFVCLSYHLTFLHRLQHQFQQNDLQLLKNIVSYKDSDIFEVASTAFSRHLWYIAGELTALAFLDPRVPEAIKIKWQNVNLAKATQLTVSEFVTQSAKKWIDCLMLPSEFLPISSAEWKDHLDYQADVHSV